MTVNTRSRRYFLKTAAAGVSGYALTGCGNQNPAQDNVKKAGPPNIILILADDMGYSDIGCFGSEVKTPNIDRLASNGLRFTQFYNTARCCPTRASLLTGLYQHQAGIGHMVDDAGFDSYRGDLAPNSVTIAEALKGAGYGTYMSGKWHVTKHLGHWSGDKNLMSKHNWPRQRGFDRFYGTIIGCGSFYDPVTLTRDNEPIEQNSTDYFYTNAITDNAIDFISGHVNETPDTPFFCYVAYTSPHWPMHALEKDIAKYKGRFDKGWDTLRKERLQRMIDLGIINPKWALTPRDGNVPAWEDAKDKQWECRLMEVYAAMIDNMDQNIGRLLDSLESQGKLDNTLIFFLSDNGGCAENLNYSMDDANRPMFVPAKTVDGRPVKGGNSDHTLMPGPEDTYQSYRTPWANLSNTPFRRYKHWVHEGGISTPLVVHWPAGIEARGAFRKQPGHLIDIMATCVDVSGGSYPVSREGVPVQSMEGRSLLPAFADREIEREAIYWEHEGNRAVRRGKWKLVSKFPGDWELYDLEADRSELNDLAKSEPEKVGELSALWEAWADRVGVVRDFNKIREGVKEFRKHYNNRTLAEK